METPPAILKTGSGKWWLPWVLGGIATTATAALVIQWKHASLGRQVSRNVVGFLIDHGAKVEDGVISGGVVAAPLKVNSAVMATISEMLRAVGQQLDKPRHTPSSAANATAASTASGGGAEEIYVRQKKPKRGLTEPTLAKEETLGSPSVCDYNIDEFRPAAARVPPSEHELF